MGESSTVLRGRFRPVSYRGRKGSPPYVSNARSISPRSHTSRGFSAFRLIWAFLPRLGGFPGCSHSRGFSFMHLQAFQLFQLFDRSRLLAFQLSQPFPTFFGFVVLSAGALAGGSDIGGGEGNWWWWLRTVMNT
jgi:hypothetical protein